MAGKTVDANQMLNNWKRGMQGAGTKYIQGINNCQVNPMALAAQPDAMQRFLSGVQNSVTSGKRAQSLMSADVNTWKKNATTLGASALAGSGMNKGADKYGQAAQKLAGVLTQASAAANALPKGGIGNAMARVNAALQVIMGAYPK